MKFVKTLVTGAFASASLLPLAAHAADTVVFVGAGSSAQFNAFAQGAITTAGASNIWSFKNGATIADTSTGSTVNQNGNVWVVWDTAAAGSRKVYVGVSVDSIVGVRSFFNNDTVSINQAAGTAGGNLIPGQTDTALPTDVHDAVQGAAVNVGLTDVTPEDAKVQSDHVITDLGYSVSNPILDSNGGSVKPIDFSLTSRAFQTNAVGAAPIIFFVNKTVTTSGHLGATTVKNVDRFALAGLLDGTLHSVGDIDTSLAKPAISSTHPVQTGNQVVTFIREPLSGTYTTTEYDIVKSLEVGSTQEKNVTTNPLNETTPTYSFSSPNPTGGYTVGGRVRAIGTGGLVAAVGATKDSLGYSFWSVANFANVGTTTRYLTVDGSDPFYQTGSSVASGTYPTTTTLPNIVDGAYPAWSLLRAVTDQSPTSDVNTVITNTTGVSGGSDYVNFSNLKVFRQHRTAAGITANNGIITTPEHGGDVGGAVLPVYSDVEYYNLTGSELTDARQ
jgi:hypothetical protein